MVNVGFKDEVQCVEAPHRPMSDAQADLWIFGQNLYDQNSKRKSWIEVLNTDLNRFGNIQI